VYSQRLNAPLASVACRAVRHEPVVLRPSNIDYHIAFDANFYSVSYTLVQERVEVRATPTTIEIFHKDCG